MGTTPNSADDSCILLGNYAKEEYGLAASESHDPIMRPFCAGFAGGGAVVICSGGKHASNQAFRPGLDK
jgi:hypothetical protein